MNSIIRSDREASSFIQSDENQTRPLEESGLLITEHPDSPTRTWSAVIDDVLKIRGLEDDWDGQGSEAPDPALVDGAITLAQDLRVNGWSPPDFAIAGVDGTVFFEWHNPVDLFDRSTPIEYLEIEVTAPDQADGYWIRTGSEVAQKMTLTRHF